MFPTLFICINSKLYITIVCDKNKYVVQKKKRKVKRQRIETRVGPRTRARSANMAVESQKKEAAVVSHPDIVVISISESSNKS